MRLTKHFYLETIEAMMINNICLLNTGLKLRFSIDLLYYMYDVDMTYDARHRIVEPPILTPISYLATSERKELDRNTSRKPTGQCGNSFY